MLNKFSSLKSRAKKRQLKLTITFDQFKALKNGDCFYCGVSNNLLRFYAEAMKIKTPWMTLDRKDNAVGYLPENVVGACFLCNKIKGSFFSAEEMLIIGRLLVAPKLKEFEDQVWDTFMDWCKYAAPESDFEDNVP